MEFAEPNYALISSPYDSFMRKHLQHYGYFTGRSEIVKKYGFIPSKSQLFSSSSDSDSSSSEDEHRTAKENHSPRENAEYKGKPFVPDTRIPLRQARFPYGFNLRGHNDDSSFEPRWPIEIEVLQEARVKHINVVPKQPEPFYKSTHDHMPFVRSYDEKNGRVVFDYTPETCGYFVRSRIGGNREGCRQVAVPIRGLDDTTVIFESRFESGNLMKAVQVGEFEYELYLRYDLYTKRNTQWFYFRLQNIRTNKRYRFTIVNFFKPTSLYSCGMKPLMYSVNDAEKKNIGWRRCGEEIVYYKNNLTAPNNPSANLYSLSWTCKFPNDDDTYYFAHCYPYTYSDLQDYLNEIQSDTEKSQYCKQKILCRTLAGNFIYMLTITNPISTSAQNIPLTSERNIKKGVVVTARVHPGETNASWMMKGLLDFLLGDSADAQLLRDHFVFKIIPMLNPDGVIVGNYRCSLSGRDLNRNYKTILKDAYPSIWHTREMIKRFMTEIDLVLYCDFHGHSRKQNVFLYGCENKHLPNQRLKERIFPAMLSKNDPSKFSYSSCKFKVQKQKEGTGRVVMWSLGIMNSYTLEATFCGSTQKERAGQHFNTKDLESIGHHFLDALLDFCDPDHTKRDRLLIELEDNFRQMIQMKLMSRGINPGSLDDIDLDQYSSEEESSDDGGSDSSIDDGLPKHLEVIAAAKYSKVRYKKTKKRAAPSKQTKNKKDEIDKENVEKTKPVGLSLSKSRNPQFPTIDLLETTVLKTDNNTSLQEPIVDKRQRRRRRRASDHHFVCQCITCLNARLPRTELLAVNESYKQTPPISTRRTLESSDSNRYDTTNESNNRVNRWPILPKANNAINRTTPAEEKARRSQAEYYKILTRDMTLEKREKHILPQQLDEEDILLTSSAIFTPQQSTTDNAYESEYSLRYSSMPSCQNTVVNQRGLVNEPRDAFTATYLLRRLNSLFPMQCARGLERDSNVIGANTPGPGYQMMLSNSQIDEETTVPIIVGNETDLDVSRTLGESRIDETRQQLNNYVTSRLSVHLNERILGSSRNGKRPKSSSLAFQNRVLLDIRSIQAPIQPPAPSPKRTVEQPVRQRAPITGGKQSSAESNSITSRSNLTLASEKKADESLSNRDNSSSTISKQRFPIQPDNIPINLVSRYESMTLTQLAALHKSQTNKNSNRH